MLELAAPDEAPAPRAGVPRAESGSEPRSACGSIVEQIWLFEIDRDALPSACAWHRPNAPALSRRVQPYFGSSRSSPRPRAFTVATQEDGTRRLRAVRADAGSRRPHHRAAHAPPRLRTRITQRPVAAVLGRGCCTCVPYAARAADQGMTRKLRHRKRTYVRSGSEGAGTMGAFMIEPASTPSSTRGKDGGQTSRTT